MNKHKRLLKNLLTNALINFEMAYIITELFAIQQVPVQEVQKTKASYFRYYLLDIGLPSWKFHVPSDLITEDHRSWNFHFQLSCKMSLINRLILFEFVLCLLLQEKQVL